ncbi:glycosyltransferase family 4 protein [Azospirillum sp. TSH64]|uniref:glycosyltransferase family 4 protein n=1 Tax=Azospirillum sp. TSH64 TaxID=652740 RepID=UPI000D604B85|nr:glycosyltransferase family 4 protein [Azospirillum sp. TSH64]PWC78128.1 glycosyl transferase family 1 [Azospirillum sp. TSH64]
MNFLFIHQNFPGQFLHLVRHLVQQEDHRVTFITQSNGNRINGVDLIVYQTFRESSPQTHHYLSDLERGVIAGQAVYEIGLGLKKNGYRPDVVIGHCGWGETLYVKDVWPDVPVLGYFEFYYLFSGGDIGFDPTTPIHINDAPRIRTKNAINHLSFDSVDWGLTPTRWQWSLYPDRMRRRISIIHEGVDTDIVRPEPDAWIMLADGRRLTRSDRIVTYVARNLEPYRGFHIFMRALPRILHDWPDAQVLIVGGDGVSYGPPPPPGKTFRELMLGELGSIDLSRVHFVGSLPYARYLNVLQISAAHVYLSYPFVLSWSCLEAMAAGCAVIGSATIPVEEAVVDGETGLLFNFFDPDALAGRVGEVLGHEDRMRDMRDRARQYAVQNYDVKLVTLPRQLELIQNVSVGNLSGYDTTKFL